MSQHTDASESCIKFLLQELTHLEAERLRLKSEAIQRMNFFVSLTSAVLGGLVLLGQSGKLIGFEYVAIIPPLFLFMIGCQTLIYLVNRDISTDRLLRASGRIRRYFSMKDQIIIHYLTWQDHDEPTKYITRNDSASRRTVQLINSLLLSLTYAIIIWIGTQSILLAFVYASLGFIVFFQAFVIYSRRRFRKAVKLAREDIRYPKTSSLGTKAKQALSDIPGSNIDDENHILQKLLERS